MIVDKYQVAIDKGYRFKDGNIISPRGNKLKQIVNVDPWSPGSKGQNYFNIKVSEKVRKIYVKKFKETLKTKGLN